MPSRPSAARRRLHRDRVIAKRIAVALAIANVDPADIVEGRLDDQQFHLGCKRPKCRACNPTRNFPNADRQHADREWRRVEGLD